MPSEKISVLCVGANAAKFAAVLLQDGRFHYIIALDYKAAEQTLSKLTDGFAVLVLSDDTCISINALNQYNGNIRPVNIVVYNETPSLDRVQYDAINGADIVMTMDELPRLTGKIAKVMEEAAIFNKATEEFRDWARNLALPSARKLYAGQWIVYKSGVGIVKSSLYISELVPLRPDEVTAFVTMDGEIYFGAPSEEKLSERTFD